jgi:hypothetical protein
MGSFSKVAALRGKEKFSRHCEGLTLLDLGGFATAIGHALKQPLRRAWLRGTPAKEGFSLAGVAREKKNYIPLLVLGFGFLGGSASL